MLERVYGAPEIINDGATIARAIELPDPQENAGAKLVQEVKRKVLHCTKSRRSHGFLIERNLPKSAFRVSESLL